MDRKIRVNLTLKPSTYDHLKRIADEDDRSMSNMVDRLVERAIEAQQAASA